MDIQNQIAEELWASIEGSYLSDKYTSAIREALAFVTQEIRNKSGLDGDGRDLVGRALGFSENNPPRIRVNKLQTQTEKSMQQGLREVLQGMYGLVRNPRSHEVVADTKEDADAIILFIDYLLEILGKSTASFTVQGFEARVRDQHFVHQPEYAAGLVEEIPLGKRLDVLIVLFRGREWHYVKALRLIFIEILQLLTQTELDEFLSVVSASLLEAPRATDVGLIIALLPSEPWIQLNKLARLRAENMLIVAAGEASYDSVSERVYNAPATWLANIAQFLTDKQSLRKVIIAKLRSGSWDEQNFVGRYLTDILPSVFEDEHSRRIIVVQYSICIEDGNEFLKECLLAHIGSMSEEWQSAFARRLEHLTDPDSPEIYLADGTPFLGKDITPDEGEELDEIPF